MTQRVVLVQTTDADANSRTAALQLAGFEVEAYIGSRVGNVGLLEWLKSVPEAFVLDLDRSPSVSRAKGMWLRNRKDTRLVPLVFCGGTPEKVDEVRGYLPDATFASWDSVAESVRQAIATKSTQPVVPDVMAPYKGATLARKLNIRAGKSVALLGAPEGFEGRIGGLPAGVLFSRAGRKQHDITLLFVASLADLARSLPGADRGLRADGALWVVWPKRASGVKSDLTQAKVREHLMRRHWVDYKVASIDDTWTGMVYRRRDNTEWLKERGK